MDDWKPGQHTLQLTIDDVDFSLVIPSPGANVLERRPHAPLRLRFKDANGTWRDRWVANVAEGKQVAREVARVVAGDREALELARRHRVVPGATVEDLLAWWLTPATRGMVGKDWTSRTAKTAEYMARHVREARLPDGSWLLAQLVMDVDDSFATAFLRQMDGLQRSTRAVRANAFRRMWSKVPIGGYLPMGTVPFPLTDAREEWPTKSSGKKVFPGDYPTTDQVLDAAHAAVASLDDHRLELAILVTAFSGLRLGELLHLIPSRDVHPTEPLINIKEQVLEESGKPLRSAPLKNTSKDRPDAEVVRDTLCPEPLTTRLREWGAEHPGELLMAHPRPIEGTEMPFMRANYARSLLWQAAESAGWAFQGNRTRSCVWGWHSLRHHFATWALLDEGHDVADVAAWMGHSDIKTTLQTYVHQRVGMAARARRSTFPTRHGHLQAV